MLPDFLGVVLLLMNDWTEGQSFSKRCQCRKPGKTVASLASLCGDRLECLPVQKWEPYGAHHTCATQSVLAAHCFQNSRFFSVLGELHI